MTVAELIKQLQEMPQDLTVHVWDSYYDEPTDQVVITQGARDQGVFILNFPL